MILVVFCLFVVIFVAAGTFLSIEAKRRNDARAVKVQRKAE